jgi:hypothetical protein
MRQTPKNLVAMLRRERFAAGHPATEASTWGDVLFVLVCIMTLAGGRACTVGNEGDIGDGEQQGSSVEAR